MKNFEAFEKEIRKLTDQGDLSDIAVSNGQVTLCSCIDCDNCDFNNDGEACESKFVDWLYSEYIKPQPKLTFAEYCFLLSLKNIKYFAREANGVLKGYTNNIVKNNNIWEIKLEDFDDIKDRYGVIVVPEIFNANFDFIKWSDEKAWSIEELLSLNIIKDSIPKNSKLVYMG